MLVFERKVLRMIYGPFCINGEWRILYNYELKQRYHHADVVQKIRAKRLRWTGHVVRMEPETPTNQVFSRDPVGDRRRGRPKTRWTDLVEAELLRIPNWKTTARNKQSWRKHVDDPLGSSLDMNVC